MVRPFEIDVITLFPSMFEGPFGCGPVARARACGRVRLRVWDLREFSRDPHRKVDDVPFGGGPGMVLMPEPLVHGARHVLASSPGGERPVLLMSASGERFDQGYARRLSRDRGMVILCGRYEGVDARVAPVLGARELSVGDYVLSGGEPAAIVIIDAVVRLLEGVVGKPRSVEEESFAAPPELTGGLLEYPHYTRPRVFERLAVPEVLLSGDHGAIARWRREQALRLTWQRRPELLRSAVLTPADRALLAAWEAELSAGAGP